MQFRFPFLPDRLAQLSLPHRCRGADLDPAPVPDISRDESFFRTSARVAGTIASRSAVVAVGILAADAVLRRTRHDES